MATPSPFRWHDGERLIVFGSGCVADAPGLLGDGGYTLLTTERTAASAPAVLEAASAVRMVEVGRVDELAAKLRPSVEGELLVALGGGRVVDTAKALAAADPPRRVAAIPTTLSGAEMTAIHRHATGVAMDTPRVRPAIVINDPALCASQPVPELASSASNALGHAVDGPLTPLRNPVATQAALDAVRLLDAGLPAADASDPDRATLALGALLAGYVIGSTGYGLHHILAQTLARFAGVGHGPANAIMLPHSIDALTRRFPDEIARVDAAAGDGGPGAATALARRLCELTGDTRLRDVGVSDSDGTLERCAQEAAGRPELHLTPPAADHDELLALYRAAW
jgi:alcohol dehydrogenase class IV